jgi:hypothetical protein
VDHEKEGEGVDEVAEEADEITYTRYSPAKVKFGKEHPGKRSFIVLHVLNLLIVHTAYSDNHATYSLKQILSSRTRL